MYVPLDMFYRHTEDDCAYERAYLSCCGAKTKEELTILYVHRKIVV